MKTHTRTCQLEQQLISAEASDYASSRAFRKLAEDLETEIADLKAKLFTERDRSRAFDQLKG